MSNEQERWLVRRTSEGKQSQGRKRETLVRDLAQKKEKKKENGEGGGKRRNKKGRKGIKEEGKEAVEGGVF